MDGGNAEATRPSHGLNAIRDLQGFHWSPMISIDSKVLTVIETLPANAKLVFPCVPSLPPAIGSWFQSHVSAEPVAQERVGFTDAVEPAMQLYLEDFCFDGPSAWKRAAKTIGLFLSLMVLLPLGTELCC